MKFCLYHRENGFYYIQGKKGSVRVMLKSLETKDKVKAQEMLERTRESYEAGKQQQDRVEQLVVAAGGAMKFKDMSDMYLETYSKHNKKSYIRDRQLARHVCAFLGDYILEEIKPLILENFKNKRKQEASSPREVNMELAYFSQVFNKAISWEKTKAVNPIRQIKKLPVDNIKDVFLEPKEIKPLLKNACSHLKPIIIAAISTGLRSENVLSLTWQQVDMEKNLIYIPKTKSSRDLHVRIGEYLKKTLQGLKKKEKSDFVFTDEKGRRFKSVKRSLETACRKAGIQKHVTMHVFRKTHGSLLAMNGVGEYGVGKSLGISNPEVQKHYIFLSPDYNKKMAETISDIFESIE